MGKVLEVMPVHVANVSLVATVWRLSDAQEGRVFRHLRESWARGVLAPRPERWGEAEWSAMVEIWGQVVEDRDELSRRASRRSEAGRNAASKRWASDASAMPTHCEGIANASNDVISKNIYISKTKSSKTGPARRSRRAPESFQPNEQHVRIARERGVDLRAELERFRDYEFAVGKTDWPAAFRNWLRNARVSEHPVDAQVRRHLAREAGALETSVWEVIDAGVAQ